MCSGTPGHQILPPISPTGTNLVKQGSTVPAKFRVCYADGVSVGTPGVVTSFRLVQIVNGAVTTPVNDAVLLKTPEQSFRWDASDRQWIANIDTKPLLAGEPTSTGSSCNDGSAITFQLTLR